LLAALPVRLTARKPEIRALEGDSLGARLRRRRHELGLRRVDAAAVLGTSWKSLMWWERDVREPLPRFYPAIIAFLGAEPWPEPATLPERLRVERLRRGLTIEEAADTVAIDEGTYRRWEGGEWKPQRRSTPLFEMFLRAADGGS